MAKERMVDFCTSCRRKTSYRICKKSIRKVINDKSYEFEISVAVCNECGKEMDIPGLLDANMKSIERQYKQAKDLLRTSNELK